MNDSGKIIGGKILSATAQDEDNWDGKSSVWRKT